MYEVISVFWLSLFFCWVVGISFSNGNKSERCESVVIGGLIGFILWAIQMFLLGLWG